MRVGESVSVCLWKKEIKWGWRVCDRMIKIGEIKFVWWGIKGRWGLRWGCLKKSALFLLLFFFIKKIKNKKSWALHYGYPFYQKTEIDNIVKEFLESGSIKPSQSPFSSPVLPVRKAYGSWRMCIDYRGLNKETVKDKFLIPVVDELLDELQGA